MTKGESHRVAFNAGFMVGVTVLGLGTYLDSLFQSAFAGNAVIMLLTVTGSLLGGWAAQRVASRGGGCADA